MRKGKKRTENATSDSYSSSDDESIVKNKKARNGAGKKDGANDSDFENEKKHKSTEDIDKKSKSKLRVSETKSNEQKDEKKKKKNQSKEKSDQSSESASEEETLSKIAKTTKKSGTSSSKEKSKDKDEEPSNDHDESTEEYEVEEIITHKKSHSKILYLIRWKGFGSDSDTWENSDTLENCPEILKKYAVEHPDSLPPPSSKKPSNSKKEKRHKKQKEIVAEEVDETKDYEVEKIIDVFFKKDKSREFLIRWKGYQSTSDSWEPEDALNCADLIEKYMSKVEQAKNCVEKELRPVRKHTERFTLRTQETERRLSRRHDGKQRAVYYDAED